MSFADLEGGVVSDESPKPVEPSQAVAARIFQMTTQLSTFRRLANSLGTPRDSVETRRKLHDVREHLTALADEAAARLRDAQHDNHLNETNTYKKLQDAKLAKDFQQVLLDFQGAQRLAAERETLYPTPPPPALRRSASNVPFSSLLADESGAEGGGGALPASAREQLHRQRQEEVQLVENELVHNELEIEERAEGIRKIQQQIGEVNEIFKDLALLVRGQGHVIDDLESDIEASHNNTELANKQLNRAVKRQKISNKMTYWFFGLLLAALAIFFLVFAS
eukprot:TRINITY_DN17392_c0_g1_i1.p1 TRINITY_DN17392_c0_g1~~TRINITY_DN17392_c0_g1_i1.p1  ORF type:complete len:280 (+),score=58.95 TRINITY_DN17392_c0_g1_i1:344-1183(+)